jgi:hypothetical protein
VQALAPMSRRVSQARINAISFRSPGGKMGVPFTCQSISNNIIARQGPVESCCGVRFPCGD